MGNLATALIAALVLTLASPTSAEQTTTLPSKLGYTFYVRGERVGESDVRLTTDRNSLRIETKFRVDSGVDGIELSTRTEADPRTYALRSFSYRGMKGGKPVSSSVTVEGDSVYGAVAVGGDERSHGRLVTPTPILVWEDWAMDIEILLGLQQAREFKNPATRGVLLAGSYASAAVTLGFTGEAAVEAGGRTLAARKLVVAIEGGAPFESLIDPKRGIPVYIHFPAMRAEVFLDDFFGDNPASRYTAPSTPAKGR